MVRRTDIWRYFYGQYGDLSEPENFEHCLADMLTYKRIARLNPDPERVRKEFWQGEPSYGRVFGLIHSHHAEAMGRQRWGDKSLHNEHHLDEIFAEFPQAKVILCVRDPRDRFASERLKFRSTPGTATRKWKDSIRAMKDGLRQYPEGCMVLPYETLASHPEEMLHKVCEFIGEEYSPMMLTMRSAPRHLEQDGNSSFERFKAGEISTKSIGRFSQVLSVGDIAFIQILAGVEMEEFGYRIHPVQLDGLEVLNFYAKTFPLNLARMTRSTIVNAFNDKRGRKIRPHRIVSGPSLAPNQGSQ